MTDLFDDPDFKDFLREYFMNEVESERNKAMSEDSRRLEWERGAWNQRETLLKKELQEKRDEIARLKAELAEKQERLDAIRDKLLANNAIIISTPKELGLSYAGKINQLKSILHQIFHLVKHQHLHIEISPIESEAE